MRGLTMRRRGTFSGSLTGSYQHVDAVAVAIVVVGDTAHIGTIREPKFVRTSAHYALFESKSKGTAR
jgi:hypothetical protein